MYLISLTRPNRFLQIDENQYMTSYWNFQYVNSADEGSWTFYPWKLPRNRHFPDFSNFIFYCWVTECRSYLEYQWYFKIKTVFLSIRGKSLQNYILPIQNDVLIFPVTYGLLSASWFSICHCASSTSPIYSIRSPDIRL